MTGAMKKYIAVSCPYAQLYGQQHRPWMRPSFTAPSRPHVNEKTCETCRTEIARPTISIARVDAMNLDARARYRFCPCKTVADVFTNEECVREANDYT